MARTMPLALYDVPFFGAKFARRQRAISIERIWGRTVIMLNDI